MAESTSIIRADFDRIAWLSKEGWNSNNQYHGFLLRHAPSHCREVLEVGCGTGAFSRLLALRAERVLAIDLSPQMIEVARERSRGFPNIEFEVADVLGWDLPEARFDCIATIATLHHLPMTLMLAKMKDALKVGGVLLILDLFRAEGVRDVLTSMLAMPVNVGLRLMNSGRLRVPREVRRAWAEHERHDSYQSMEEVRRDCAAILPGASVRQHLLWRYSVIWKKSG